MSDQHLVIEITAVQDDLYRVAVETAQGTCSTEAQLPFEKAELRNYLALLRQSDADLTTFETNKISVSFGQKLFYFLIGGHPDILRAYHAALERAGNHRVFIWLSAEHAGRLAAIPWEFLHDGATGFLALSRQTPIIRRKPELSPRPPAPLIPPLRALVVIPSPPNYAPIQVEAVWEQLHQATLQLQLSGQLRLERLEHATWPALRRQLRAEDYHVLHFIGHTQYDDPMRQGFLALEDDSYASGSRQVNATELGNEMGTQSTVRLVVVNAHPDSASDGKAAMAIANQLLQGGLASALTTQFSSGQATEALFNAEFYRPLCEAHPVEAALNVARRTVAEQIPSPDWGAAALFLRTTNGDLFRPLRT